MSDSIIEPRDSGIDPEIAGPIPPNSDQRQRDILQDQEDRQRGRQAVGESIVDAPPPPPQEALEVSPPPPMPSLFTPPQAVYDVAKEAAQDVFRDFLKNITINGVSPDVAGGEVSFNIPTEPSASSSFASMNSLDIYTKPQEIGLPPVPPNMAATQNTDDQINNLENQINETKVSSLEKSSSDKSIPLETNVLDSVKVEVQSSNDEQNVKQRSWTNYEGDKPIESKIGTSFYAESEKYGPSATLPQSQPSEKLQGTQPPQIEQAKEERPAPRPESLTSEGLFAGLPSLSEIAPEMSDMMANTEKAKDYASINDPFAQYVLFTVCKDGEAVKFLIPSFGPFPA